MGNACLSRPSPPKSPSKRVKRSSSSPLPVQEWFKKALAHHGISEIPVTSSIALLAASLSLIHNDPCDRFIIATCLQHHAYVITSEPVFSRYKGVKTLW